MEKNKVDNKKDSKRKPRSLPRVMILLIDLAIVIVLVLLAPRLIDAVSSWQLFSSTSTDSSDTYMAQVDRLLEADTIEINGLLQAYQLFQVTVVEGPWAGETFQIDYGKTQFPAPGVTIDVGDRVLVTVYQNVDGDWQAYFVDFERTNAMLWLVALFAIGSVLLSGWKGVRSILSMLFSFAIIFGFIIPRILAGQNPVIVSTVGAFIILAVTLYMVYGWTLKTHSAVLGTLMALSITGGLAYFFMEFSHLTGFGSEEALFLTQQLAQPLDLRGIVLSSILIGALGVLDDLVITQASAVFELHSLDPRRAFGDLYRQSMRIGQDHVAATVNTLVLAYTGAALPLLLLVSLAGERFGTFINREFVAEEVVRTMVGSLGLIAAVPITTGLACFVALNHTRLGRWGSVLGPLSSSGDHGHHHHH